MPVTYRGKQGTMHLFELPDPSGSGGTVTSAVDEATAQKVAQHTGIELGKPSYIGPQGATPLGTAGASMGMGPAPTRPQMAGGDQRLAMGGIPDPFAPDNPMTLDTQRSQSQQYLQNLQGVGTVPKEQLQELERELPGGTRQKPKPGTIPLRRPGQQQQQAGGLPPGVVATRVAARPSGMVPVGVTQQGIDPQRLDQLRQQQSELQRQQFRTMQQREKLTRTQLEAQQAQLERLAAQRQREAAEAQRPLLQLQERIDSRQREFDQLREQVRNQQVDMDAAQGGAMGKGLGIIAAALGAFGSTLSGTPNHAAQMLENVISRHVDAQLANMNARSRELTNEERRLIAMSDDRDELRLRMKVLMRESEMAQLEAAATEGQLGGLQQATLESLQALRQQQLADQATLEQMVTRSESARFDPGSPGGVRYGVDPRLKAQAEVGKLQREAQGPTEKQVVYRGQNIGSAISEKGAEELRVALSAVEGLEANIDQLHELAGKVERLKDLNPADYSAAMEEYKIRANALRQDVWSSMYGRTDAPSGPEADAISEMIPETPSVMAGKTRAQLGTIKEITREKLSSKLRANNLPVPAPLQPSNLNR